MSDRFTPYASTLATVAVLISLGGACAAEELQPKDQAPQLQNVPPRFLYIHCATQVGDGPCGLDPAMQGLSVHPRFDRPDDATKRDPLDRPDVSPAR